MLFAGPLDSNAGKISLNNSATDTFDKSSRTRMGAEPLAEADEDFSKKPT